jgi:5-methylthioadenosine/S-adenosylhomocysteine deaminase
MTAEKVLEMSTIMAARALGIDNLVGSIENGKKADLILVDMSAVGMAPSLLPLKNLVYSTSSSCVHTVIINGKTVMSNREFTQIDTNTVVKQAENEAFKLLESSGHLENKEFLNRGGYTYL